MMNVSNNHLFISVEKQGPKTIVKDSFPLRYGTYSEIKTFEYEFRFNLNGEIKFIRGLGPGWPHPAEHFKRTDSNDWVYYTVGDDSSTKGVVSWMGEYYLPCLAYPSNPVWEVNYFSKPEIMGAFAAWPQLYANLFGEESSRFSPKARGLIKNILNCDDRSLHERALKLHAIIGGRVTVLPPDTRHVDYEIIPLNISDGCLYQCEFCCVKSSQSFKARPWKAIDEQIRQLKAFYGRNIENYSALFLGTHDALAAGDELIIQSATLAYQAFGFDKRAEKPYLFLFGSVDSLLKIKNRSLENIDALPFYTYINIGLESFDESTLKLIGKPLTEPRVHDAFFKILEINHRYENIEATANFVMGEGLADDHFQSLVKRLGQYHPAPGRKGVVYLSPLKDSPKKRELLPMIHDIKDQSKLPVFIYLIQRL